MRFKARDLKEYTEPGPRLPWREVGCTFLSSMWIKVC